MTRRCSTPADQPELDKEKEPSISTVSVDPAFPTPKGSIFQLTRSRRMKGERVAAARVAFRKRDWRRMAAMIVILMASETRCIKRCDGAVIKIGFLVDWGRKSPLYPAAAAAAAKYSTEALGKSGVFPAGNDTTVTTAWVWHDTACNADNAYEATEVLLDVYGVDIIVGPACCRSAAVASMLAHRRGVPVISWGCSSEYLSDKILYPSFLRVVGSSNDFAPAVGALFRRHGWDRASILYAQGATRELSHSTEAWQIQRVLEAQKVSIGALEAFDGTEACLVGAGDALGARRAVEAAESSGDDVIIVVGECADYRQVMTHAASRGLARSGQAWILVGGARNPECHRSASICGRDDGRDALALSSMSGALSIDWSSRSTSLTNSAAYAEAVATHARESFAAEFTPPPGGNASPLHSFCSSVDAIHCRRRRGFNQGVSVSCDEKGRDSSEHIPSSSSGSKGNDESKDVEECRREGSTGGYEAVPPGAPVGVLQAAALMYDAVELGGRLLVAAGGAKGEAKGELDAIRQQQEGGVWSGLAADVEFEGLSGTVKFDSNGNRYGMDVSFWVLEGEVIDGFSYTLGTEAARFTQDTGQVQILREMEWPAAKQQWQPQQSTDVSARVLLLFGLTVLALATVLLGKGHLERRRKKRSQQQLEHQQRKKGVGNGVGVAVSVPDNSLETGKALSTQSEDTSAAGIAVLSLPTACNSAAGTPVLSLPTACNSAAETPVLSLPTKSESCNSAAGIPVLSLPTKSESCNSAAGIPMPSLPTKSESYNNNDTPSGVDLRMPDQQPDTWGGLGYEMEAITNGGARVNTGSSKQKYDYSYNYSSDFAAFSPVSEGHLKIVENELKMLSSQATRALEEIEVDGDDIIIGAIIGSGSFAEVRRGFLKTTVPPPSDGLPEESKHSAAAILGTRSKSLAPVEIALKVLKDVKRQTLRRFWFEVLIMKDLNHPNIVRLLGASWRGRRLMMIMEFVARGNLAAVLHEGPQLTWKGHKFEMCLDIAKGMAHLHRYKHFDQLSNTMQNCVIHRDLKPQNLLVTHDFRVKITDFGEATGKGDEAAHTQVGTLLYIAPEIVRGDCYDKSCDVYSFAIVLLDMLQLRDDVIVLFGEEALRQNKGKTGERVVFTHMAITNSIVNEGLRPTLPDDVFTTLKILIEQCWSPTPAMRPTFDDILELLDEIARYEIVKGKIVKGGGSGTVKSEDGKAMESSAESTTSTSAGAAMIARAYKAYELETQEEIRLSKAMFSTASWGKKRGKNCRPFQGTMGMEFLEKHKGKCDTAPYTIEEGEEQTE